MEIKYVAFDSYGIKSSCVQVTTKDIKVIIDPGIANETGSFPLPLEEKLLLRGKYERRIRKVCKESDIIILTHYHFDHFLPDQQLYEGKTLLIKDPKRKINKSQKGRAKKLLDGLDAEVEIADDKKFEFGKTEIEFSKPVWHGVEDSRLGYVLMVKISDGKKTILHTSDVDGPTEEEITNLIIEGNPDVLMLDGSPTYLLGYIVSYYNLARSILNTIKIMENMDTKLIILDHHLARDYRYPDLYFEVYKRAKELKRKVTTAAEFLGERPKVLEGYEKCGATKWKNWGEFKKEDMIDVLENAVENELVERKWLSRAKEL